MKRCLSWWCLLIALVLSCLFPAPTRAQPSDWSALDSAYASLIIGEFERHPLMELRDLYKFVHQSAMGPGHAVPDTTEARKWMESEIAGLNAPPDRDLEEATITPLRPDSGLVRVNLRPYLEGGGDAEALLLSFIETANRYEPSVEQLKRSWSLVIELAVSGEIPVDAVSAGALIQTMADSVFPAVHHTRKYFEAYQPAYRVVQKSLIPSPAR